MYVCVCVQCCVCYLHGLAHCMIDFILWQKCYTLCWFMITDKFVHDTCMYKCMCMSCEQMLAAVCGTVRYYTCTCTCKCAFTVVTASSRLSACAYPHTHTHTHARTHAHAHTHTHTHTVILTQWYEEVGRLLLMRQTKARGMIEMKGPSPQNALVIAQAAAAHAASQQLNKYSGHFSPQP